MRALQIRHPHIDRILEGKKIWEMRGARTLIRETIGLIASGSGTVIGVCDLIDCVGPLSPEEYRRNAIKAGMRPSEAKLGYYRQTFAWVFEKPRILEKPVFYQHPLGAVIWVSLNDHVARAILKQLVPGLSIREADSAPFGTKRKTELERAGKMAAWTKKNDKNKADNPYSRENYYQK